MARPEPEPGSAPRILLSPATPRGGRSISINLEHNEYRRKIEAPRPVPPALAISIAGAQQGVDEETGEAVTQYEINVQGKEEGQAGQWWVLRRYSQFADLYAALSEQFPDEGLPSMPRKTISSPSDKRVGQRRLDLEKVLRKAAQIPDVMNEPLFREFVGLETVESGCARFARAFCAQSFLLSCMLHVVHHACGRAVPFCRASMAEIICAAPAGARVCVRRSGCNAARSKPAARHGCRRMCRGT